MKRKGATLEQNSEIAEELLKMLRDGESVSEVLATKARLCEGSAQPKKNDAGLDLREEAVGDGILRIYRKNGKGKSEESKTYGAGLRLSSYPA